MKTFKTLLKTELKLSLRGMDMVIFAICLPLVMLVILGMIYGNKPASAGADYTFLEQSFGALASISICAGGVMGLPLVVSEYRGRHILKHFKVTPMSPAMILLVQVTVYAIYAVTSLASLYFVAVIFFECRFKGTFINFLGGYLLVMVSMFSVGLLVGGLAPNTKSAGMIASILYFPMLIFSGATLPFEVMPQALQKFAEVLPLTQGIKLLKAVSLGLYADRVFISAVILTVLASLCIYIAIRYFRWD